MPLIALALAAALVPGVRPLGPAGQAFVVGGAVDVGNAQAGRATVGRYPLDGGPAALLLDTRGRYLEFAATPQRAAASVGARGFIGDTGPLQPLAGRFASFDVAGDSVFLSTDRGVVRIAPDGTRTPLQLPRDIAVSDFGGDWLGFSQEPEADQPVPHLRLFNWRTLKIVRRLEVDNGVANLDTREDGAMVLDSDGEGIKTVLPGQAPAVIHRGGGTPTWAGDRVVLLRHRRGGYRDMLVIEPGGRARRFGVASPTLRGVSADAGTVAWSANGCAMTEPVTGGPVTRLGPGPCARSEAMITNETPDYRGGAATSVPVRCLYADARCTGTVTLRGAAPVRYALAPGERRQVPVRVPARLRRRWRHAPNGLVVTRARLTVQGGHTTTAQVDYLMPRRDR